MLSVMVLILTMVLWYLGAMAVCAAGTLPGRITR